MSEFSFTVSASDFEEYKNYIEAFLQYSQSFLGTNEDIDRHLILKIDHSNRVFNQASQIVEKEFSHYELIRSAKLGALFHDIGRFEQFSKYHTFADAKSVNHGLLGSKILKKLDLLSDEKKDVQFLIQTAVALHNRLTLPGGLKYESREVLKAVRDADKIDILRIMAGELGPDSKPDPTIIMFLKDDPKAYTLKILRGLESDIRPSYEDMVYVNDFRLVLCTWLKDINYASSFSLLAEAAHLDTIVSGLSFLPEVESLARSFLASYKLG